MLDPPSASEMLAVETAVSEPILTLVDFIQETALVCLMRPIKEVLSFLASLSQVKVAWIFPFGGSLYGSAVMWGLTIASPTVTLYMRSGEKACLYCVMSNYLKIGVLRLTLPNVVTLAASKRFI